MSFPVYVSIGSLTLHPHWVFEGLAYIVGLYWYHRSLVRHGDVVDRPTRWRLIAAALVGGIAGSRLLGYFDSPALLAEHWMELGRLVPGQTIVGGLVGGVIAVEWVKRRLGVEQPTGDIITVPLIVGIALGRIGCFLTGLEDQTFGVATALPWGVDFGDGVSRHPTQLYEVLFLGALAAAIVSGADRRQIGDRFKMFLLAYVTFRLAIDFLKPGVRLGGLTTIQWVCLAVLAFYVPQATRLARSAAHG
jgi:phosphatidylglycerol---prolipoprotein diacylglyceryl transferase